MRSFACSPLKHFSITYYKLNIALLCSLCCAFGQRSELQQVRAVGVSCRRNEMPLIIVTSAKCRQLGLTVVIWKENQNDIPIYNFLRMSCEEFTPRAKEILVILFCSRRKRLSLVFIRKEKQLIP